MYGWRLQWMLKTAFITCWLLEPALWQHLVWADASKRANICTDSMICWCCANIIKQLLLFWMLVNFISLVLWSYNLSTTFLPLCTNWNQPIVVQVCEKKNQFDVFFSPSIYSTCSLLKNFCSSNKYIIITVTLLSYWIMWLVWVTL